MRNSSSRNNPYTSLGFGSADKASGSVRGQASVEAKRQVASQQADAARQLIDFWSSKASAAQALPPSPPKAPKPPRPAAKARSAAPPAAAKARAMKVLLHTDTHVKGGHPMAAHVASVVGIALARFGQRVTRVEAHLADVNGQPGTQPATIQCLLQAHLVGLEPVVVKHQADDAHQAIDGAVGKLKRAVGSSLAKQDPRREAALKDEQAAGSTVAGG